MGTQHPLPENIPHLSSSGSNGSNCISNGNGHSNGGQSGSPVKESSFLHRETSVDDQAPKAETNEKSISPAPMNEGVPIRWQH